MTYAILLPVCAPVVLWLSFLQYIPLYPRLSDGALASSPLLSVKTTRKAYRAEFSVLTLVK